VNSEAYPKATADAMARPKAADLPRPRAAVSATVLRRVFSEIASKNVKIAFACQKQMKKRTEAINKRIEGHETMNEKKMIKGLDRLFWPIQRVNQWVLYLSEKP
jgi:hypothetical protein